MGNTDKNTDKNADEIIQETMKEIYEMCIRDSDGRGRKASGCSGHGRRNSSHHPGGNGKLRERTERRWH